MTGGREVVLRSERSRPIGCLVLLLAPDLRLRRCFSNTQTVVTYSAAPGALRGSVGAAYTDDGLAVPSLLCVIEPRDFFPPLLIYDDAQKVESISVVAP